MYQVPDGYGTTHPKENGDVDTLNDQTADRQSHAHDKNFFEIPTDDSEK